METRTLDDKVNALIEDYGASELLRTITRCARKRYETLSRQIYEKYSNRTNAERDKESSWDHEPPRDKRTEMDMAIAWLCLDVDWAADSFDALMANAGLSRKERCELENKKRIAELERQLSSAKNLKCS